MIRDLRATKRPFSQLLAVAIAISIASLPFAHGWAADATSFEAALGHIRGGEMQKTVNALASDTLEGREAGSRGGIAAAAYLIEHLRKLPVKPSGDNGSYIQYFGNGYRNILVTLPGSDPEKQKEYLLVGAHFDHVG